MGKTIMGAIVSVDGFMADESDGVGPLFECYFNGDHPLNAGEMDDPEPGGFGVSKASHDYVQPTWDETHRVPRSSSGMWTVSTSSPSGKRKSHFRVPSIEQSERDIAGRRSSYRAASASRKCFDNEVIAAKSAAPR